MVNIDSFDKHILSLLKVDSRRTGEQLAQEVGLSSAACLRRVQRLRESGAIEREVAIISPKLEDRSLVIVVLLSVDGHNPKLMDEFCQKLRRNSAVQRLLWVTGDDDIVLILHCTSMSEFGEFAQNYINEKPVNGYKTLVSMREYQTWDAS